MLSLLALLTTAQAANPGHYHPGELAPLSTEYTRATGPASSRYAERSEKSARIAAALSEFKEALDLLGARAPADQIERYHSLKRAFNREMAVLQAFASAMMDDFDGEFTAAMDRAASRVGSPDMCASKVPNGRPMPGMPVRMKPNPDCSGADRNADVAAAMDSDALLNSAITEIIGLQWPSITEPSDVQASVGDAERWIAVGTLFRTGMPKRLRTIDRQDADRRIDFEAAIEEGASQKEREALVSQAKKVSAATAAARSAVAEPTLLAGEKLSEKLSKKGEEGFAWCANPTAFGGCKGADATGTLLDLLMEDKKVAKTLP